MSKNSLCNVTHTDKTGLITQCGFIFRRHSQKRVLQIKSYEVMHSMNSSVRVIPRGFVSGAFGGLMPLSSASMF